MENAKTLSELFIDAGTAQKELNEAILSDSFTKIGTAKERMEKAIKEYNDLAVIMDFKESKQKSAKSLA